MYAPFSAERAYITHKGMKSTAINVIGAAIVIAAIVALPTYAAVTPTLSLSSAGGGSVNVSISADPNATVMFYYNVASASGMQTMTLGTTNSSGYFSTTLNAGSYNINAGQSVYVVVDGAQSDMQTWPSPTGTPTLNETSLTVGLGQSASAYSQGSSAAVYIATNSNPSAATAQTNGTQITVTGEQIGSTNLGVCYTGTGSDCANLSVNVQTASVLTFSQNNLSVAIGQGTTITVSGGSGTYSITSNSNPSVMSAVLSGNSISISPLETGNADVTVCDNNGNCATLYVTIGNVGSTSGSIYFSEPNPSMTIGQIINETISGGSGYYITGNSNPSVASLSLNDTSLAVSAITDGSTSVTICSTSNGCGTLTVNVGSSSVTGNVTFGITNPSLAVGETSNISLSGGGSYYVSSNENSNIAQPTVNGSSISLYGENAGSDSIVVCVTGGGCGTLYVTVNAQSTSITSTNADESLLAAIQSMQSQLAQIVSQIQTMATTLTQLASDASQNIGTNTDTAISSNSDTFTEFLSVGSEDGQVTALQQYLLQKGFYSGPVTGYYGALTEEAVEKYQTAHGIDPAGYVGPSTRAALNAGE